MYIVTSDLHWKASWLKWRWNTDGLKYFKFQKTEFQRTCNASLFTSYYSIFFLFAHPEEFRSSGLSSLFFLRLKTSPSMQAYFWNFYFFFFFLSPSTKTLKTPIFKKTGKDVDTIRNTTKIVGLMWSCSFINPGKSSVTHIETGEPSRKPKATPPKSAGGRLARLGIRSSQTLQSNRWLVLSSLPMVSLLLVSLKSS